MMAQKDNSTLRRKVALRTNLLATLNGMGESPVVLEGFGGVGAIYHRCYRGIGVGVVFEKNEEKAKQLAVSRPTWAVYEGDTAALFRSGIGSHLPVNFLDLDPYGGAWDYVEAFFGSERPFPSTLALAVNDGLRNNIKMHGWATDAISDAIQTFGQKETYANYLEVCRWKLEKIVGQRGYSLTHWTGYYCGHNNDMTHYAAICRRTP
jgi:hypothetical protein